MGISCLQWNYFVKPRDHDRLFENTAVEVPENNDYYNFMTNLYCS